jgi:DnaJ-class molecular chaperone
MSEKSQRKSTELETYVMQAKAEIQRLREASEGKLYCEIAMLAHSIFVQRGKSHLYRSRINIMT